MLLTTTPTIEGKHITKYCGIVAGEAVLGANALKDLFAGIRDFLGGRSGTYEKELQRARDIALDELKDKAKDLGANAVVGIDIDYEVLGKKMVCSWSQHQALLFLSNRLVNLNNPLVGLPLCNYRNCNTILSINIFDAHLDIASINFTICALPPNH